MLSALSTHKVIIMRLKDVATKTKAAIAAALTNTGPIPMEKPLNHWNPHIAELLVRFHSNEELDCPQMTEGDKEFIGHVFNDVLDDPSCRPTAVTIARVCEINGKLARWKRVS